MFKRNRLFLLFWFLCRYEHKGKNVFPLSFSLTFWDTLWEVFSLCGGFSYVAYTFSFFRCADAAVEGQWAFTGGCFRVSLIELLVVVAILAILAAIAIPLFLNQKTKAIDGTIQSDLRNLIMQVETAKSSIAPGASMQTGSQLNPVVKANNGFKATGANSFTVVSNCAVDVATGLVGESSPGNYVIIGNRWPESKNTYAYSSKTSTWYVFKNTLYPTGWADNPATAAAGTVAKECQGSVYGGTNASWYP